MKPSTKGYQDEIKRVAFERITNTSPDRFYGMWMERGHAVEPEARMMYEAETFNVVKDGGFFALGDYLGASPDGLVGDDGLLEIKCPKFNTMIDYLIDKEVPREYYVQIQTQLLCSGKQWCDFMAYHPSMRTLIKKVYPDNQMFGTIIQVVEEAIPLVEQLIEKIK